MHFNAALNTSSEKRFYACSKLLAYGNVPEIHWAYIVICYTYVGCTSGVSLMYITLRFSYKSQHVRSETPNNIWKSCRERHQFSYSSMQKSSQSTEPINHQFSFYCAITSFVRSEDSDLTGWNPGQVTPMTYKCMLFAS